jgi:hypothetical protein
VSVTRVDPPSVVGTLFVGAADEEAGRALDVDFVKLDWDVDCVKPGGDDCAFCVGVADEGAGGELVVDCVKAGGDVCNVLLLVVVAVVGPAPTDAGAVVLAAPAVSPE